MKKTALFLFTIFIISSCNNPPKNEHEEIKEEDKNLILSSTRLSEKEGLQILTTKCYTCHNPKAESHDDLLAPPLMGIKNKYKNFYTDRTIFVARMSDFIIKPTKDNALMKGPVWHFGLMPKVEISNQEAINIAAFIYDNNFAFPEWFPKHFEDKQGKSWEEQLKTL